MPVPRPLRERGAGWRARLRAAAAPALLSLTLVAATATAAGVVDAGSRSMPGPARAQAAPAQAAHARTATGERGPRGGSDDKRRADEARLKAAFLFNFLKYAEFPDEAFDDDAEKKKAPLVVLVVGDDPFEDALETTFDGKEIGGRAIVIERTEELPKTLEAHLVFTKGLDDDDEAKLIEASRDTPCILVGDDPGFAERGGFINFYMSKRKPRFEVNVARQKDTGVELSASLLKLAKIVEEKESPEKRRRKREKKKKENEGKRRGGAPRGPEGDDRGGSGR